MGSSDDKLKLSVFYCSNCLDEDEFRRMDGAEDGVEHTFIGLPCSGRADLMYLMKAFETGADGLVLVTCPENECHYLEGNLRALKRSEEANAVLKEAGMNGDRIAVLRMSEGGTEDIVSRVKAFREAIRVLRSSAARGADTGAGEGAAIDRRENYTTVR